MKIKVLSRFFWTAMAGALLTAAQSTYAVVLTEAGTAVNNTASLAYKVSGADQSPVSGSASFLVDRKVAVTVTFDGGATPVAVVPGQAQVALKFTVTNLSNDVLDYVLTAANAATSTAVPGGADTKDIASAFTYYEDTDNDGVFNSLNDTVITGGRITNLPRAVDDALPGTNAKVVFVVADIPAQPTVVDTDILGVSLSAKAYHVSGGAAVTNDNSADDNNAVQNVLADAAGAIDNASEGDHSAYGAYQVETVELTLTKSVTTVWDPINNTTNPKAIPGAVMEYCLLINNPAGGQTASNLVVTDAIPANTTYYSVQKPGGPLPGVFTGAGANCATGQHADSYGSYSSGTVTADFGQNVAPLTPLSLAAGGTPLWVRFYVTVNN